MENRIVKCQDLNISNSNKICLIAGPCQLETEQHALDMAGEIKNITEKDWKSTRLNSSHSQQSRMPSSA